LAKPLPKDHLGKLEFDCAAYPTWRRISGDIG